MEDNDDIHAMESKATARKLPIGWLILFFGLIAFGVYYTLAYTPAFSGWTQAKAYTESINK
ncbi:MAG TPA: hypothetical protein VMV83_13015 [Rectinemataceae bacterium]|nr:hypothetical protein [Rectinemataceae bacterium]